MLNIFLPYNNPIYYKKKTDMLIYPGRNGFNYPYQHLYGPNILKAWRLDSPKNTKS